MVLEEHKSLKAYNTFGIDCNARYFISAKSVTALKEVLSKYANKEIFILGGGSNMLLTKDIDALVVHVDIRGISVVSEDEQHVQVKAMAGENWHDFVLYCIEQGYGGIENLSLIPGNIGTAPIQNIGAYGVELKDVFHSCSALNVQDLTEETFYKSDCEFQYRDSIFKNKAKGKYIITSVTLTLTKKDHTLSTSYGAIQQELKEQQVTEPTIEAISKAVIAIRQSKLPDPAKLGNSGSFFKNPVIDSDAFQEFRSNFPDAPFYEVSPTEFKIPAGWLIEQAGFKGKRFGDAGVHDRQALVLINHGTATGNDIWELALRIQKAVKAQFGIYIEPEVNII
ncbi:MAG: UDP-N-acetylmuramate dehydrogenase [Flavobacteriales bacterium]|uniref:UDP-N-acetylmuramate dehydrogenase n=1 Tax=Candidatus Ulvibacter alkanivorans TaxID=2267620 RepID=UPI000DF1ACA1|nr:UDP-N-acetylmuramate dehydrogenase [Candidatus Ulvibacter alkanivorans]MCH2489555.1 UDP-N-acetylmuramate dehydrogenase [Flavobacteriales bacterium]